MMLRSCCVRDLDNLQQSVPMDIDVWRCKVCRGLVSMPYVVELLRQRAVAQDARERVTRFERDRDAFLIDPDDLIYTQDSPLPDRLRVQGAL